MKCPKCGNEVRGNFCPRCGYKMPTQSTYNNVPPNNYMQFNVPYQNQNMPNNYFMPSQNSMYYNRHNIPEIPYQYKPISMWGYFGYELLFSIPIAGFICLIIFALGGTSNINLKNFARSYFCIYIILIIVVFLFGGLITAALASLS